MDVRVLPKDAIGNDVVIGDYYAYSHNKNGYTKVVIGRAVKVIETIIAESNWNSKLGGITVEVICHHTVYNGSVRYDSDYWVKHAKTTHLKNPILFPVSKEMINKTAVESFFTPTGEVFNGI